MRFWRALGVWLMLPVAMVTFSSCARAAEQTLLTQFFAASRLRDLTALSKVSTVVFEPASDGIVTSFEITAIQATQGPDGHPMAKAVSIVQRLRYKSAITRA